MREPQSFGKRQEPATITITRAGRERRFVVRPMAFTIAFSVVAMFMFGYFGATAYLVFRDDLIGGAQARNARLMREYEDRIAALRANLDHVTSRQMLDQQAIELKIEELLRRQDLLRERNARIGALIRKAEEHGLAPSGPDGKPAHETALRDSVADPVITGSVAAARPVTFALAGGISLRGSLDAAREPTKDRPMIADRAATDSLFASVVDNISAIERGQRLVVADLQQAASERSEKIAGVMRRLKVPVPELAERGDVGGPFIAAPQSPFEAHVEALDASLGELGKLRGRLGTLPLANPSPGRHVTSTYGTRIDPFLGRAAMHSGIDFGAPIGTSVKATAAGTVIDAGRNGGYGNMVEIDHGDGITTRYAHLSRVKVKSGDRVERGSVIGLAGSTGRSTGPHLHYEIRRKGKAVDPAGFLKAGRELSGLY
ncbi:MAG: M23 family metallopeptidase [Pseudomonadota bacterium]|nr:M23 family metallopeptidase [Pseudomonadota bacterium]